MVKFPEKIKNVQQLEELLSRPTAEVVELFKTLDGDILFLGIAGKIGPSIALMAKRAIDQAGVSKRVIGVSRFSNEKEKKHIESFGIETIQGDLLEPDFINSLPKIKNVIFLAGMKFGAEGKLPFTWAMNSYVPAMVAEHFKESGIVAFSTGCVYPLVAVESGGAVETDRPFAVGEYAQSCLGRERMFEFGSIKYNTPVTLIRLNYAVEMRYGVLVDIAIKVKNRQPVDLSMGYFNVIWQGDSNNMVLRALGNCESPAKIFNITGPILSVRDLAKEFGRLFGIEPKLTGQEERTAFLSNPQLANRILGQPEMPVNQIVKWVVEWINDGHDLLGKPTHFEVRDGKY